MRKLLAELRFAALRNVERRWSVSRLHSLLKPFASLRAEVNAGFKPLTNPNVPRPLKVNWTRSKRIELRANSYLNQTVRYFQDRLAEPKWSDRCQWIGLDPLRAGVDARQPVILAFCHYGPYSLLRSWLRAAGIPAAILIGAASAKRDPRSQLLDGILARPDQPTVICLDQLRDATTFAGAGIPLLVAIDGPAGKQIEIPFNDGWKIQIATGAIRLAVRYQATLFPCIISNEGDWRYRVRVCEPVPQEFLSRNSDWNAAGEWIVNQLKPHWIAQPEQCGTDLLKCFRHQTPRQRNEICV